MNKQQDRVKVPSLYICTECRVCAPAHSTPSSRCRNSHCCLRTSSVICSSWDSPFHSLIALEHVSFRKLFRNESDPEGRGLSTAHARPCRLAATSLSLHREALVHMANEIDCKKKWEEHLESMGLNFCLGRNSRKAEVRRGMAR